MTAKRLFNRACKITISKDGQQSLEIDEKFRIQFQITKTLSAEANAIEISIFNLARETQQSIIEKGEVVQLEVGYENFTEILAIGEITRVYISQELPDSILRIEAGDAIKILKLRQVNFSFGAGAEAQRILDSLLSEIQIPKDAKSKRLTQTYQNGFSFSGNVFELLNLLVQKENLFWSIQDRQILIFDLENPESREAVSLSENSGLIGSPERLDDFGLETNRVSQSGWSVRSLLNPKIRPGNGLILDSKIVKGQFLIDSAHYVGDTKGNDWVSEIEVYG